MHKAISARGPACLRTSRRPPRFRPQPRKPARTTPGRCSCCPRNSRCTSTAPRRLGRRPGHRDEPAGQQRLPDARDIDAEISLPASVWTKVLDRQEIPLERGSRVVALIKAEFWLKTGRLNMSVKDIRPVGLGDLLARIERLRHALAAEGLFSDARKKRLPLLPHRIGLITGRDSDAKKDVLRNAPCAGPPSNSRSARWPSRATPPSRRCSRPCGSWTPIPMWT